MPADWDEIARSIGFPVRPLQESSRSLFENTLLERKRIYDLFAVRNRSGVSFVLQVDVKSDRRAEALSACVADTQWVV
jgi:hypothetical protein